MRLPHDVITLLRIFSVVHYSPYDTKFDDICYLFFAVGSLLRTDGGSCPLAYAGLIIIPSFYGIRLTNSENAARKSV